MQQKFLMPTQSKRPDITSNKVANGKQTKQNNDPQMTKEEQVAGDNDNEFVPKQTMASISKSNTHWLQPTSSESTSSPSPTGKTPIHCKI
mmetsp:Transcript_46959/g.75187  ORF Transcript_46959/g.75187 Transcript_46959/m.75187 type:complete len:90 (+) Transcript_46959:109-378(+)